MDSPALLAAQHMNLTRRNQEIIANNLANADTPGFQSLKPIITADNQDKNFAEALSFAISKTNSRDVSPGDINHTQSAFDFAIVTSDVYFAVQNDKGENLYTRNGRLGLNQDRQLIQLGSGFPLTDSNFSPITLPVDATNISLSSDGTLSANGQIIAKVGAFKFADSQTLTPAGKTLLKAPGSGNLSENAVFLQNGYETSNTNPILTMAQMIELHKMDVQDTQVIATFKDQTDQQTEDLLKPLNV